MSYPLDDFRPILAPRIELGYTLLGLTVYKTVALTYWAKRAREDINYPHNISNVIFHLFQDVFLRI